MPPEFYEHLPAIITATLAGVATVVTAFTALWVKVRNFRRSIETEMQKTREAVDVNGAHIRLQRELAESRADNAKLARTVAELTAELARREVKRQFGRVPARLGRQLKKGARCGL